MKLVLLHHELMEEEGNTFQDLIDDSFFNVGRSVWCGGYH
jgi:hypothetical protein